MKKRILSIFLAFAMLLGMLPATAFVAPTLEEAMKDVKIFARYNILNWLTMNGSVKEQRYIYYNYTSTQTGEVKEIPAYCVDPNLYGVPEKVPEGTSIRYGSDTTVQDPKVCGIIANGYPHQPLETLGLQTVDEAYYATKTALWTYLLSNWSIDKLGINPNLTGADRETAERVLEATKTIYWRGMVWDHLIEPKLTATADRDTAYPVTINGEQCYQQIITITSETWAIERVKLTLPDTAPAGTKIMSMDDQEIDSLELTTIMADNKGFQGQCKIVYPASVEGQTGTVQLEMSCVVDQYKIFYAKTLERDTYGNIQDYMLDTDPHMSVNGSFISRYAADDTEDEDPPGDTGLKIVKLEEGTETPLEGAVFKVTAPDGTVVGRFSSGPDGTVTIPLSITGHYTVEEESAPLWHLLDENSTQHVTVKHGEVATVTFTNAPYGSLQVRKVDADTGANLNGANIQIKNAATGAVSSAVTAAGGVATFEKLEPGTYEVTELTAPEGYVLNSKSENVVVNTGELATVTLQNSAKPGLRIIKYDSKSMTLLPGATFEISRDGVSLGRFTTDAQGEIALLDAQPGTYLVQEVRVDDSHIVDPTPQQIELSAGDGILELIFYNAKKPGIHILKVDSANPLRPLSGAVFEIRAVGGSFHEERKTEGDGTIDLSDLEPGAYTIKEKKAPDGYLLNDAVRTIQIEGNQDQSFVFTNTAKPSFTLVKLDSYDSSPLGGVTFRIAKIEDGSHYLDRVTDSQGKIHIEGLEPGVYSVSEIDVPEKYVKNKGEWHVELFPGKDSELVITNDRRPNLTVWKHDADTGESVPNTVFQVRAADGHSVDEIKTDSTGKATLANLLPGMYEISEKSVPSTYLLDAPSQLVTLYPNWDHTVYFENHKKPSLTVMKVDSASGDVIKGAEFHFWYGSNNTTTGELNDLGTYQTNADGLVQLTGLRDGWYQVTETEPAKGYAIKEPGEQSIFLKGGESRELLFENIPLSAIVVWKFDSVTKTAITGAEFQVRYLGGTSGTGGTVIGNYKTGANGAFTVTGLKGGTYVVEEVSSDSNHVIDTAPQTVLITGQDQDVVQVYFGNTPKGSALIRKIDALTHEPLSGVEFTVTDSTGAVVGDGNGKFTTDSSGSFLVEDLDPGTTLVVRESRAKDGYILDETPQTVQVKPGKTVKLEFANQPKSSLMIVKKDAATGKPLSGVEFLVTAADGTYIGPGNGKYTTDSAGTILVYGLTPGTSVVARETRAKSGYLLDNTPQTATIKAGSVAELEFLNQPAGTLIVEKRDSLTNEPLAGVEFKITTASGEFIPDADGKLSSNGLYKTDSEGQIILSGIVGTLIVTETKTIDGYVMDPENKSQAVVVEPNDTQKLVFYNTPKNTLIITKYATDTMEPLAGVKYLVTASDGSAIGNSNGIYFTDERGQAVVPDLTPGMTVTAREMETVSGYTLETTPQSILVKAGEPLNLIFGNKPLCNLTIQKRDSLTKKPLAGAQFLVTDQAGLPIGPSGGHFTTGSSGLVTVTGIRPDTAVTVREEKAPSGYVLDTQPQTITVKSNEDNTLTFDNDSKGTLMIVKVDSETGEFLSGAEFKITTASGELVADQEGTVSSNGIYTTDQRGEIRISGLEPNSYVVTETKAPKGHILDSTPITVEVTANDAQTLRIPNTPTNTLVIQKVIAGTDGEPLKGVKFLVTDDSGAPVGSSNGEFVTDENGRITLQSLTPGSTITAREVQTVEGFVLNGTPKSIKIKEGEVQTLTFYNAPVGGLELIKVSESDRTQRIPNTTFEIRKMDGGLVETVTTNKNGRVHVDLDAGDYYAVETEAAKGFKLDATPQYFTVEDGKTTTLTITNKAFSGILLHKIDANTRKGIYGAVFLLYDANKTPIGQYTSDDRGYVYIEDIGAGRYYLRELANEGYIVDEQLKTVNVTAGTTTEITWENTAVTGQLQIVKTSEDYNSMNGWPAGTPIPGTVFEIYHFRTGNLAGTVVTDKNGVAVSSPLPLGRYKIVESKAADFYALDKTPIEVEIEYAGQIVKAAMTNKSLYTNVSIKKTGYVEVMPGQTIRYDLSDIANNSTASLSSFYWRDTLPTQAVRLSKIVTGTYNVRGSYKIVYRTNLSGETYRTLADNLDTQRNYELDASSVALGLASNEYVTEFMVSFGIVPANFRQVEAPRVDCTVVSWVRGGSQFANQADIGGVYNGQWIMATSRWVTKVYAPSKSLPRTGY